MQNINLLKYRTWFFVISGTTWLQEIVWLLVNMNQSGKAYEKDIWSRVPLLEQVLPGQHPKIDDVEAMSSPRIYKTHLPTWSIEEQIIKTIFISRNPKDTLVSYFQFARMIYSTILIDWSVWFNMFCQNKIQHSNWFEYVLSWSKNKERDNFLFLHYEDLITDIEQSIKEICNFLQLSYDEELISVVKERTTFNAMKNNPYTNLNDCVLFDGNFLRKGEVGDWKNYFTDKQNEYMDKLIKDHLEATGMVYRYE